MIPFIKNFIECNIASIEQNKWEDVFRQWYDFWWSFDDKQDKYVLLEFFKVLTDVGIPVMFDSLDARMKIISDELLDYIKYYQPVKSVIYFADILDGLNSFLGLEKSTLRRLLKQVCKDNGYDMDKDYNVLINKN